jgi:phosphatidylglycerophosphate synthase
MASTVASRRPLKSRNTKWAAALAHLMVRLTIMPNRISVASMFFAALAGACLYFSAGRALFYLGAALCIQGRLVCNLIDGMVAVEGGFRSKSGDVFNELPDRISDVLILAPIGYALPEFPWAVAVSWSAAVLAVITAYVRALGASLGMPQDFSGPMAKPQRMAAITAACVLTAAETFLDNRAWALAIGIALVAAGSALTVVRRTLHLIRGLEAR